NGRSGTYVNHFYKRRETICCYFMAKDNNILSSPTLWANIDRKNDGENGYARHSVCNNPNVKKSRTYGAMDSFQLTVSIAICHLRRQGFWRFATCSALAMTIAFRIILFIAGSAKQSVLFHGER
ncbi:MAG: hypothetical protein RBR35_06550, partial [Salinivirgaceae bacterium]|nr:hypothetical protein [Salinivirgaceae bacterium]